MKKTLKILGIIFAILLIYSIIFSTIVDRTIPVWSGSGVLQIFVYLLGGIISGIDVFVTALIVFSILIFLQNIMPSDMFSITKNTILDLVETKRGGLLSIGVISSIFLSSNGFNTLIKTFNSCHRIRENRSFYETRLIAMLLTFVFFIVTIICFSCM